MCSCGLSVRLESENQNPNTKLEFFLWYMENNELFFPALESLSTVFGTGLTSVSNACGIQCTSDDVVSGTRKVLNTAASDQNNAVFLQIVSFTGDVACYFDSVGRRTLAIFLRAGVRFLRVAVLTAVQTPLF